MIDGSFVKSIYVLEGAIIENYTKEYDNETVMPVAEREIERNWFSVGIHIVVGITLAYVLVCVLTYRRRVPPHTHLGYESINQDDDDDET
mmetsp:Transcript_1806/g.1883  ORF Transcript_1806/g.1883 Transcript_1806/m.1883 type:complete len:90 (-) Transcript_1806:115-384(-)